MKEISDKDRWLKVRSLTDGWITIDIYAISEIHSMGGSGGFSMRMYSGSLILMTNKEGNRVLNKILPKGIRP